MSSDLISIYSLCISVLCLLTLSLAFHTGTVRGFIEKSFSNPEDVVLGSGNREGEDGAQTQRWMRAHRNTIENLLPFALLGYLLATQLKDSEFWAYCFVAFTGFRLLHTLAYVASKQPFRTLSFFGGWVITMMMGGKLLMLNM